MPSSFARDFADPEDFAASISFGKAVVDLTVKRPGLFRAKHTRIDLHQLRINRFLIPLPQLIRADMTEPRVCIAFLTDAMAGAVRDGVEFSAAKLSGFRYDHGYFHQTFGPVEIANISLPVDEFTHLSETIGRALALPSWSVTPSSTAMARLQRLQKAASDLAEYAPAVLAHSNAMRGLEQALIEAMMDCLGGEVEPDKAARRQHAAIMRRFDRVVEDHLDEPLYVPELCKEVGASMRTLLACCQAQLGMGPKHYLLLRRMHLVRRALRRSAAADTTVTEIAAQYGFWQFGRFAVEYKALFGESPSATLGRVE